MPRRPGPPPKNPDERARRNVDPILAADGWVEIQRDGRVATVPDIPEWVAPNIGIRTIAMYLELAQLPQAVAWEAGDWLILHSSLPLLDRYLERPGSESYKAWTSVLDPGLRITSDSMQKARMRVQRKQTAGSGAVAKTPAGVTSLNARRDRLKGA